VQVADYVPLQPGEHPRMLLRRHDVPTLRQRLKTPFGRAYLEHATPRTEDLVNLGLLHQLTGDREYAMQAMRVIERFGFHAEGLDPAPTFGTGSFGHRFVAVWLAYDMCGDAWPAEVRDKLAEFLSWRLPIRLLYVFGGHGGQSNWNPCSNY
jgi:hypothetical protein